MKNNLFKLVSVFIALILGLGCLSACGGAAGAVEAWALNQGGTGTLIPSELKNGTAGIAKWTVWLNNKTFGKILDFSTSGSLIEVKNSKASFNGAFSVSVWAKAPAREEEDRILLSNKDGSFSLFLDGANNHELNVRLDGVKGIVPSGLSMTDGKWHHVLVAFSGSKLTYYVDGREIKSCATSGSSKAADSTLYIGNNAEGDYGFDGGLAELKLFRKAVAPSQATKTVLNAEDNEPQQPSIGIKKGIALDRRQYIQPEPLPSEGQTVTEDDIINCINMGFDHVKLLLTPNHLIDDDGSLIVENMEYITRVIGYVEAHNFKCILCIHPEGNFKMLYLKNLDNFETLLSWYTELAQYIGEHWSADTVALQLMTEPGENNRTVSWSWMSDRMWGAVRNVLPDHTILTSSDSWGNIEYLKYMSPADDDNLIYTFTTYEPYTIGWYYYNTTSGQMTAWSYVHDIPYPVEEGVDYTEAIEYAISDVPESLKAGIRAELTKYVNGEMDSNRMENQYDSLYNANWHMLRAASLDEWRRKNGGNIHIMCVEFGCMDAATPATLWKSAAPSYGISNEKRIEFTRDMRSAFDAYDIGWDYWSYNEAHTIFKTTAHSYGDSPNPEVAANMFDYDMLTVGLGLIPLTEEDPNVKELEKDADWHVLQTFEGKADWFGSGLVVNYSDAPSGFAFVEAAQPEADNTVVFAVSYSNPTDISKYENGYCHLWVYVEDVSLVTGGQVELCSGGGPDMYETSWNIIKYLRNSGWNELYLPFKEAGKGMKPCNLNGLNYIRIFVTNSARQKIALDYMYLCTAKPEGAGSNAITGDSYVICAQKDLGGWIGSEVKYEGEGEHGGWISANARDGAGSAVFATAITPLNLTNFKDGSLHMWVYFEDAAAVKGGQIELTSSGGPDAQEIHWDVASLTLVNGWNELVLPVSDAIVQGGDIDWTSVCYSRIYFQLPADQVVGLGEMRINR